MYSKHFKLLWKTAFDIFSHIVRAAETGPAAKYIHYSVWKSVIIIVPMKIFFLFICEIKIKKLIICVN